jgi:hypothetical protein
VHGPIWAARRQKHRNSKDIEPKWVHICDLELEDTVKQCIDRLLEFFSCPMPALEPLSKHEQRRQMRKIFQEPIKNEDPLTVIAHCRSFKELQCVALEGKKQLEKQKALHQ